VSPLAQALLPLYRGYLRRLDEMVARIGEGAALREPTARDDSQKLVRDESGFVVRFDVADSRTGETFEVHGAHRDGPAQSEVRFGAVTFVLEPGNWEELTVRCAFSRPPADEDLAALAELLQAWAVLAAHGGFKTDDASAAWTGRLHSAAVRIEGAQVVASVDLGTCPPGAFDVLAAALGAFAPGAASVERVVIGATRREDS
jgi:hypothetical protein